MIPRIFSILIIVIAMSTVTAFGNGQAYAKSTQEECEDVKVAIPEVSCKTCGDCAVVTLRTGEKICKQCNEFQCDKIECSECSESECATQ